MNRKLRLVLLLAGVILLPGMIAAGIAAWYLLAPNTTLAQKGDVYYMYIRQGDTMEEVTGTLSKDGILVNAHTFATVAKLTQSDRLIKPGRYRIAPEMNNYRLLQKIRNGLQDPLRFTFNNLHYPEEFAGIAGAVFHFDSLQLQQVIDNPSFLDSLGVLPEMLLGHLLPNTYEIYWTISPEGLIRRMLKESETFWRGEREAILKQRGLTRDEVLILASIIQKESNHAEELSRMAGVYLNRLRIGMKLQADPTVKYANGDLTLRRILYEHLDYPSPYNTYYVYGLPPGVICAPNPTSIDAVLHYEEHDYLYFCAKPGYNSMHTFAVTHSQHLQNRRKYQAWLRSEGIR